MKRGGKRRRGEHDARAKRGAILTGRRRRRENGMREARETGETNLRTRTKAGGGRLGNEKNENNGGMNGKEERNRGLKRTGQQADKYATLSNNPQLL